MLWVKVVESVANACAAAKLRIRSKVPACVCVFVCACVCERYTIMLVEAMAYEDSSHVCMCIK
jgi:hypothetical protein